MSEFSVDPKALAAFKDLLSRYADNGGDVSDYIISYEDASSVGRFAPHRDGENGSGVLEQGIFAYLLGKHSEYVGKAVKRVGYLSAGGDACVQGLEDTVEYYEHTDSDNAARLDASYPDAKVPKFPHYATGLERGRAEKFHDVVHVAGCLKPPDGADLKPKADAIQSWVNNLANWASVSHWSRELWDEIAKYAGGLFGVKNISRDPISSVIEFFTGDWRAWAYFADGWRKCSKAVEGMGVNVFDSSKALAGHWTGHAADSALAYFRKFADATFGEQGFFDWLVTIYVAYMDIVYDYYQDISTLVDAIIDGVLTMGLDDLSKLPKLALKIYEAGTDVLSMIGQGHPASSGIFGNILLLAQAEEPASTMKKLIYDGGPAKPYRASGYEGPTG